MEKLCSKCKETKLIDNFHKNKSTLDGYNYNCKKCVCEMRKEYHERRGKIISKKYTAKRKLNPVLAQQDKERFKISQAIYRFKNTLKVKARSAVFVALRSKTLVKPDKCELCGKPKFLESHHWHGYMPDHWIDVLWLCSECHDLAEKQPKRYL